MLSPRLAEIVDALPLFEGVRVLEVGGGSGVVAREIVRRGAGFVLGIDRSATAIREAVRLSSAEIVAGRLAFRQVAVEAFDLEDGEPLFDLAFAIRVGALDGRHPALGEIAFPRLARALAPQGRFFIDGGDPLQEISLAAYR